MQRKLFIKFHRLGAIVLFGLFTSIGIGLANSAPTSAASCESDNIPCVEVSFGIPQGSTSVLPGLSYYDSAKFYLPVAINLKNASTYTVKVYGSGSDLTSGSEKIPSIGTDTSYEQLGKNGSEWGIRWNLGDKVEDKDTNYHKVPTSESDTSSVVIENAKATSANITKQLTLGFAVSVNAEQPSGSYTNTVTVAVVASPRDARSFFDISTMQEMTPDICENTTTPVKTATTLFDTVGKHGDDANYIPQTTLTDTRDNKTYLVRKLADGNCWMSQNLSLSLTGGSTTLTSADTDLNSKSSWTPVYTTQVNTGTAWGANDDNGHSSSYGWDQYWAGGTTFSASGATAYGGTAGYAQRGNYYDWFAATARSGKLTDVASTTDGNRIVAGTVQDSICPKGWTLPVGDTTSVNKTDGSVKSFYNLIQIYTGKTGDISSTTVNTLYASPMNFVPTGNYYSGNGSLSNVGGAQFYWSGTAYTDATYAWYLHFNANTVYPGTRNGYKRDGFAIRCVAR